MSKKLIGLLLAAVVSVGAIGGGAYWLGNTAYEDGIKTGISAVIEQCATHSSTFYNGDTGDVMICEGGHMTAPQKAPEKALPEPPDPTAGEPGHGSIPDHMEDKGRTDNI